MGIEIRVTSNGFNRLFLDGWIRFVNTVPMNNDFQ
jgi:hypothetical protein